MSPPAINLEPFSPFSVEFTQNPYVVYDHYRSQDPVHKGVAATPDYPHSWYIFAYRDVHEILKNSQFINNRQPPSVEGMSENQQLFLKTISNWILFQDAPAHTRYRRLLADAFSTRSISSYRPEIENLAGQLVKEMLQKDQADITRDVFRVLPIKVIASMLGADILDIDTMLSFTTSFARALDCRSDASVFDSAADNIRRLQELLIPQLEARRTHPKEDLLTYLVNADRDGFFSDKELVNMAMLLLVAGFETTNSQLGNAFLALMQNPSQWDALCADTGRMESAVNELTRYDSTLQIMSRTASADMEVGGKLIRAGDDVNLMFGSANRDPLVFKDPDRLDITRGNASRNLTFGQGIHYCIGAQLARLEIAAVLEALIEHCPAIRLNDARPMSWKNHISLRGPATLPVTFNSPT